ncbi:MAG: hypothetical protein OEV37_03820 [Candidatus Berkelbacteria bacterium]|nr:hypothetical protein [Candidatus Berkelbacteria bacterium]
MDEAMLLLHQRAVKIAETNGSTSYYSLSGGEASNRLVRRQLIADGVIVPLGRLCTGFPHPSIQRALETKNEGDPHIHRRSVYRINAERADEVHHQLLLQKPRFASRMRRGQLVLELREEGRRPDFLWSES